MPFVKGISGNRAGRPRGSSGVADYIRRQTGDDCRELIDRLLELSRDPKCPIRERVGATMHLLDRAIGKSVGTEVQLRMDTAPSWNPPPNWELLDGPAKLIYLDRMRSRMLASGGDDGDEQ